MRKSGIDKEIALIDLGNKTEAVCIKRKVPNKLMLQYFYWKKRKTRKLLISVKSSLISNRRKSLRLTENWLII